MAPPSVSALLQPGVAGLDDAVINATQVAYNHETSLWVDGSSVAEDTFYTAPSDTAEALPGTLLKTEKAVNSDLFNLPPTMGVSRIVFQTQTLDGTSVPASAYILWPYSPLPMSDGYPVAAWAHGTSGLFGDCAPSHLTNLKQHFVGPYPLASAGYVVVAPDYAGIGVTRSSTGQPLVHEYLASPSQANDLVYAVQAAQAAFPKLSKRFVAIGNSQGGSAAWGLAQHQARDPVPGFLGAIAVSPITNLLELSDVGNPLVPLMAAYLAPALERLYADFDRDDILTPLGRERFELYTKMQGAVPSAVALLAGIALVRPDWRENRHVRDYVARTANGGRTVGGPLLVIQGEDDANLRSGTTAAVVDRMGAVDPDAAIELLRLPGVTHTPAMVASQRVWVKWIADRFAGEPVPKGYQETTLETALAASETQREFNWYIAPAKNLFQTIF